MSFDRQMTEDELLLGLTDALTLAGWRWFHIRRSDTALVMGHQGWPDIFAVHPTRGLALVMELKTERGQLSESQAAWIALLNLVGLSAIVIRPGDYDRVLAIILDQPPQPPALPPLAPDDPAADDPTCAACGRRRSWHSPAPLSVAHDWHAWRSE